MLILPKTKEKYLKRLDELILEGNNIPHTKKTISKDFWTLDSLGTKTIVLVDLHRFFVWKTNCITILEEIVSKNTILRSTVEDFSTFTNDLPNIKIGLAFLTSIKESLEKDFLKRLTLEVEAELTADYMGQAERLLSEEATGQYGHVPAAVLAGAILEKSLKTICQTLEPPEPLTSSKGAPLMLNALIDALKNRQVYNEIMAKQLRTWADIRNSAAHGDFGKFDRGQVQAMISGIETFLANHSPN